MLGLPDVPVAAMVNLAKVSSPDKHQVTIMMVLSSSTKSFLLSRGASSKRLHLAPKFALRCQENFVRKFFIL